MLVPPSHTLAGRRTHKTINALARPHDVKSGRQHDEPTDPCVARAARAVVLRQADVRDPTSHDLDHYRWWTLPGRQTINRAELFAFVIATEHAICFALQTRVSLCTDSHFVIFNIIEAIESRAIHHHPQWDLIQRLMHI